MYSFSAPFARLVWALSPIPAPPEGIMMQSLYSNVYHVLSVQKAYPRDDIQADIVLWLLWRLWKNRNEFLFKGKEYEARSILKRAEEDAEEWQRKQQAEVSEAERLGVKRPMITNHVSSWTPPPTNWLKCNSDGSWHKDKATSGLRWICRDENGHVIWAGARSVIKATSPILAEAEALKWGAETMASFGYNNIIFESDLLALVRMINGSEEVWPVLQPTIEVIRSTLSHIQKFDVRFSLRGENKAADRIAKESFTFVSSIPKLYSIVPVWLKYQVRSDNTMYQKNVGE
ncbi:uncharacterized protein LOC106412803 [Brassica napus]|uniref:uncharacterized protein LOC106308621 n=1 Tax=Brassica oleracea var. oleracea TaxID=109376 RepID=UPI0006A6F27F|nr:PREDICTED: uncharacterized protein LOC106308621 [Brassica oleracea var. oleracea]XP_013709148.1 uncharacterized protein LOC106412803 [Brassica napus]